MMLSRVYGAALCGADAYLVRCEADVENGFPQMILGGNLSRSVRESADRVRTAVQHAGLFLAPKRVTLNLSPADRKKEGCAFDLPIAVALLRAYSLVPDRAYGRVLFAGELSLNGELLPVNGILAMVLAAREAGLSLCVLPAENVREGQLAEGISCVGIRSLKELIGLLKAPAFPDHILEEAPGSAENRYREEAPGQENLSSGGPQPDFSEVAGQTAAKRATMLAAGGRHNLLYIGPAGTGKSMLAERIPGIMPDMTREEALELTKLYSVAGLLSRDEPLMRRRPFRSPHHSITASALIGGGTVPRPGEISLADHGVLFLDELAEFKIQTTEALRQPLEERCVWISRVQGSVCFPANFQLVCAMNPCRCGFWPDRKKCRCSDLQVRSYLGRISRPLLDRIDLCVETEPVDPSLILPGSRAKKAARGLSSREMKEEVLRVREIQTQRFRGRGIRFNSEMGQAELEEFCRLNPEDKQFLEQIYRQSTISARGIHRLLKTARTIADFDGRKEIGREQLCEAVAFRSPEEKFWNFRREAL